MMQPPRDIPSQRSSISDFPSQDSSYPFVSSPGSVTSTYQRHPSQADAEGSRTPPAAIFGSQSQTLLPSNKPPFLRNAHSWTSRSNKSRPDRSPQRQWSLFGQLMENEGHLTPNSSIGRRDSHFTPYDTRTMASTASSIVLGRQSFHEQHEEPSVRNISPVQRVEHPDNYTSPGSIAQVLKQYCVSCLDKFSLSLILRNVLKCAIAYFLASLFTFSPALSQIISGMNLSGPSASGHLVATM